jgi:hypothetical protein
MFRILFLISILLNSKIGFAQTQFSENCTKAYAATWSLDLDKSESILKKESNHNTSIYIQDYNDCLRILFSGNFNLYQSLKGNFEKRISIVDTIQNTNPWKNLMKANIYFHWAIVHAKFGETLKAATKFRKAYNLIKTNNHEFPELKENKILLGLATTLAGAIPDNYKWIGNLVGLKGDINKGIQYLENYILDSSTHKYMLDEAIVYYAYLKFYLQGKQQQTIQFLEKINYHDDENSLRTFIEANLSLNSRNANKALLLLNKMKNHEIFIQYPILTYELAEAKLFIGDIQNDLEYKKFINTYKGKDFIKDAYLKVAWIAYLNDQNTLASRTLDTLQIKGATNVDADKSAHRFAKQPVWTLKALLEVRILIDGGFYDKALLKIKSIPIHSLKSEIDKIEYNFRYGRIFEELHYYDKAIQFYNEVIKAGSQRKEYFAARAALQCGNIYEKKKNNTAAINSYKLCLSMKNHDMQSSIDQQAKAALNRLSK